MRYHVLACDYDRTIALNGAVPPPARRLLRQVTASGRRLVLVTGRTLSELNAVFDELDLFDLLVIENGAIVHNPRTGEDVLLAEEFPDALLLELRRREIAPLALGRTICATAVPNERAVMGALAALGIDRTLAINRDSLMILPPGVDKGHGLRAALEQLDQRAGATVAVGDGENDVSLLAAAGVSVAVENAVDELKSAADVVLSAPGVDGIQQLVTSLVRHDLADLLDAQPARRAG